MQTTKSETSRGLDLAHWLLSGFLLFLQRRLVAALIRQSVFGSSLEYKSKCHISGSSTFLVISKIDSHREDVGTLRLF